MGCLDEVQQFRKKLDKLIDQEEEDASTTLDIIRGLSEIKDMDEKTLIKTKIGFSLNKVRKNSSDENVKKSAKDLLKKWEKLAGKSSKSSSSSSNCDSEIPKPFKITAPLPTRNKKGELVFEDQPEFRPNMTPKEVLQAGSFGGTYFRPIYSSVTKQKYGSEVWKELPKDWLAGLNIRTQVSSSIYDQSRNKYKSKCGASLEEWENSGWMRAQDPYGWFQWYCRFYQGRRTEDDERQIGRWKNCAGPKGRWKNNLISKIAKAGVAYDNVGVSPVVRQTLLHWAYTLTEADYEKNAKRFK